MISVRCPICDCLMAGESTELWPYFPFCSQRCRLVDLGRWLDESYRVPSQAEGEELAHQLDEENKFP